jgi:hypothetical protein
LQAISQDGDAYQAYANIYNISRAIGFVPATPISIGIPAVAGWHPIEWAKGSANDA